MISFPKLSHPLRKLSILLCAMALSGCAIGPEFVQPKDALVAAVLQPREDYEGAYPLSTASVPPQWWLLFNDPILADLQARFLAENLDLRLASERVEQSRAQLGIANSQMLPHVGVGASYTREGLSENGKFVALGAPASPSDFWQIGFDAGWELDLWGRARRAREGAAAALEAKEYDRAAVQVSLSAEVARTYLQLRGMQAQLGIARESLLVAQRNLGLVQSRERNGVATRFDTSSARAQWAAVRAMVPQLIQRRNALMNALALLLGKEPRALDAQLRQTMPLPTLPDRVPVGVPSELAHRRPDIQRAEAQLHAATAAIGVAKADFYPRIGLKAQFGVEAFESGDLDSWDSRHFSIGPTIYLPIFEGGRLKQRLVLNEARQKAAAITYRLTVLRAWHEVDNALDAWAAQQAEYTNLKVSFEQNEQALLAAERLYKQGAVDYLIVLTAQRDVLSSQTRLNASATSATLTLVNLYKALGGGWDVVAPKNITPSAVSVSHDAAMDARHVKISLAPAKSKAMQ